MNKTLDPVSTFPTPQMPDSLHLRRLHVISLTFLHPNVTLLPILLHTPPSYINLAWERGELRRVPTNRPKSHEDGLGRALPVKL